MAISDRKTLTNSLRLVILPVALLVVAGCGSTTQTQQIPAPIDVAAPSANAKTTASGLAYLELKAGSGQSPTADSRVKVHYTGWTTDGKMFDSSVARNEPSTFPLAGVIAGWTEGLQLMKEGGETRFWIPEDLAYRGQANRPAGTLVFDVSLLEIQ